MFGCTLLLLSLINGIQVQIGGFYETTRELFELGSYIQIFGLTAVNTGDK